LLVIDQPGELPLWAAGEEDETAGVVGEMGAGNATFPSSSSERGREGTFSETCGGMRCTR